MAIMVHAGISAEKALLKIKNDKSTFVDSWKVDAVTLMYLSAAFAMIDRSILHDCLNDWFGVNGAVLIWEKIVSNHQQEIKLGDMFCKAFLLTFGTLARLCSEPHPFHSLHSVASFQGSKLHTICMLMTHRYI